jgi:hypothetical protein
LYLRISQVHLKSPIQNLAVDPSAIEVVKRSPVAPTVASSVYERQHKSKMARHKPSQSRKSYSRNKAQVTDSTTRHGSNPASQLRGPHFDLSAKVPAWTRLPDNELLDMRICDLGLKFENSPLVEPVQQLYCELEHRGLKFKPHFWLSDDWYSPDGIPGIAIPFFLAHPRLIRLERAQMLEVEGGTQRWCMRILRHETGHAYDTAFRIHRRKKYREAFGRYHDPYPETYEPKPYSRDYVLHLEPWYAQSHPAEDFAETFAVWLKPKSRWRSEYRDWPVLAKLEYVDELMRDVSELRPSVLSKAKPDPAHRIRTTLREFYEQRRAFYGYDTPTSFDNDLKKLFSHEGGAGGIRRTAAAYLQKHQSELSRMVSNWTGEYRYNVNLVLREMIERCRELDLRVPGNEPQLKQNALTMLTVQTINYLHRSHHRVAL